MFGSQVSDQAQDKQLESFKLLIAEHIPFLGSRYPFASPLKPVLYEKEAKQQLHRVASAAN
jgi:hypothetical protein